ncbi:MAG: MIP family channel protein [Chloroflexi bacterium AL-W]|nr:MIP family channel protein [Chloroflexi bacterium AL-N1]NOK67193.1 MIP family channel protein [Chloroflexi bacterium AL-N10]NOK75313.1 MIP family channel protein [Chloroflexi bacterium AL-N5]NOK82101.1 MIP family channel protein [Chloroflexi bacterium AL-W]NOK89946.1 MIP family channel protein [Chloroflexi bacterium AL-N15]
MRHVLRRASAEGLGTYGLVTAGCGAIMVNDQTGALGHLGVALTFGLIIMVMIAAIGHLSGAHFNPAVTIAFAWTRHFAWRDVPVYILSQLVGAVLGALTLRVLLGNVANVGMTIPANSVVQAFGIEVLLTAVLMFVIMAVATDTRAVGQLAAIAIGATVALDALWGGPISGASMNPARSLGPALVMGMWTDQWIYVVAPLLGSLAGAIVYQLVRLTGDAEA